MHTKADIFADLARMGAPRDRAVLMHSSLRLIGEIEGGAEGLLDALIEYFTAEGGLFCVPTHTWDRLGTDKITLDLTENESNLGAFAKVAMEDGRGIRSENPTHSVVVFGERAKAEAMIANEAYLDTPTAKDSFYGRLYDADGYILLAGVGQNKNTYLHAVDEILEIPNRMGGKPYAVSVKRRTGEVIAHPMTLYHADFTSDISQRFLKLELPFRYHGCLTDGMLGNAPAELCSARGMLDVMKRIYERSTDDPMATEVAIDPKTYAR